MPISIHEAQEFLDHNKDLLDEMVRYYAQRSEGLEEFQDGDEKTMFQFHKLKTYILEKKMGLLPGR